MDENEEMLDNELDEELDAENAGEELDDGVDTDGEYEDDDDADIEDSGVGESDTDDDDDFEYDEEGNIIIPDASENEEEDKGGEEELSSEKKQAEEPAVADKSADDDKNTRIRELEEKLGRFEAQSKATLSKLGIEGDDPMEGLIKLAAEAEGVTPEQYKQRLADAAAKKSAADARQAQIEIDDLAALKAIYPELKDMSTIRDIPNFARFGHFRDMGLNPKEAYSAANPDGIREGVVASVKAQSLAGTKDHIKSNVPKASKDTALRMPKATLEEWRGIFPKKSDKELVALWKQSMKN